MAVAAYDRFLAQSAAAAAARRQDHRDRQRRYSEKLLPFIGVDGEGGGKDNLGRQHYKLICAGEAELYNENNPLSTVDCLDFILSLPANAILVGYYFTYDATQILKEMPPYKIKRLFDPAVLGKGSNYTYFGDYGIEFRPRQYFRVAKINPITLKIIPGTARTVNEVGGFFQKSFVETIKSWEIGDAATVAMIAGNKERRSDFDYIGVEERRYCAAECRLLGELMTKFRDTCIGADIVPKSWRGAGWISGRLHQKHGTPKRKDTVRPDALEAHAVQAYYGGRFEITAVGRVPGPAYEYDINSAYPAAMLRLPCPVHTRWEPFTGEPDGSLYVAKIAFEYTSPHTTCHISPIDKAPVLCPFPVRRKGLLSWPMQASGVYWSPEIEAGIRSGASVEWRGGWQATRCCDCRPFDWLPQLYAERKRLGKTARGYPIKLGINGLYGKLAQRQGAAPWRDYIAAGLITATCRSWLIDAYRAAPGAIVMLATDSLISRVPLDLDLGGGLGQWEHKPRPEGMFIVQPGIYWSNGADLPKTRGIPQSKIIEHRKTFEDVFAAWRGGLASCYASEAPSVPVELVNFIGHRLALSRNKPELAGCWLPLTKNISFNWKNKRRQEAERIGDMIATMPQPGGAGLVSEAFDPALLTELQLQSLETEAAPDYVPLGNTGE